jgi:hypothetical protein
VRNGLRLISEALWMLSDVMTSCDRHATGDRSRAFVLNANKELEKEPTRIMDTVEKNFDEIDGIWM